MKKKLLLCLSLFLLLNILFNIPFLNASYEDFTTYTETGDTGNMLFQNTTHANWTNLDRNYDTWIYKDYGIGYFTDFEHKFTFEHTEIEAGDSSLRGMLNLWVLTQQNVKAHANDAIILYTFQDYADDTEYGVTFFQKDNGVNIWVEQSTSNLFDVGIIYYPTIIREGTQIRCIIYSDSDRTTVFWDSLEQSGVADAYQYVQLTMGYDLSTDANDYSSGYITNFEFIAFFTITFRFNNGGEFRVDNATIINGTQNTYKSGTILEFASLPQNASYVFLNFTWNSNNATINPYNFTVYSNVTAWCYFSPISALIDLTLPIALIISFGVICILLVIAKIKR